VCILGVSSHGVDAEADRVTSLPGWNTSNTLDQFAGFVSIKEDSDGDDVRRDIFYWFVESESETRDDDPVILWTNGETERSRYCVCKF
jgi:carboxypeptidase C (cathepsin A)